MHYPSSEANASEQKEQRIHLRHNLTPAEALLWRALKGRGVGGLKFRRQQGIGPFVLDFYCPEARLCVELDGSAHDYRYDYDEQRTAYLAQQGIRVIRFSNDQVFTCLEGVVAQILRAAAPHPCRGGVPVGRGGDRTRRCLTPPCLEKYFFVSLCLCVPLNTKKNPWRVSRRARDGAMIYFSTQTVTTSRHGACGGGT